MRTRVDDNGIVWLDPPQVGITALQSVIEEYENSLKTGPGPGWGRQQVCCVHDSVYMAPVQGSASEFLISAMKKWCDTNPQNPHTPTHTHLKSSAVEEFEKKVWTAGSNVIDWKKKQK